jgi:hypothetical protein
MLACAPSVLGCSDDGHRCALSAVRTGLAPIDCTKGDECPIGLECRPDSLVPSECAATARSYCLAAEEQDDAATRDILLRGFGARAVQLARMRSGDTPFAQFSWEPPEGAAIAMCALFGCAPVVRKGRIVNADRCLLRERQLDPVPERLDLRDLRPRGDETAPPVALRFGCWLYDRASLIGATSLERLPAREVPEADEWLSACGAGAWSYGCALAGDGLLLGRCEAGECLQVCRSDGDCLVRAAFADADAAVGLVDDAVMRCELADAHAAAGVCVESKE